MIKDFRLSMNKPQHRVGDFRIGLKPIEPENNFLLISRHNKNVSEAKKKIIWSHSQGRSRKLPNGISTEIRCGASKKIIVKTFRDGSSTVVEENNG